MWEVKINFSTTKAFYLSHTIKWFVKDFSALCLCYWLLLSILPADGTHTAESLRATTSRLRMVVGRFSYLLSLPFAPPAACFHSIYANQKYLSEQPHVPLLSQCWCGCENRWNMITTMTKVDLGYVRGRF